MPSPTSAHELPVYEDATQLRLSTWVQLLRSCNLMLRAITASLSEQGMTVPQFDVLATLRFSEGVTQQELAERLLVTKGNVCQVLNRLEDTGWVQRRSDPQDARTNRLYLTSAGRKKIAAVLPRHDKLVASAMQTLSAADAKILRHLLHLFEQGVTPK